MQLEFPIVVAEGPDITFHETVLDAEQSFEPDDVRDSQIDIWDAAGRRLVPLIEKGDEPKNRIARAFFPAGEWIVLKPAGGEEHPDDLRSLLNGFLIRIDAQRYSYLVSNPPPLLELVREAQSRA